MVLHTWQTSEGGWAAGPESDRPGWWYLYGQEEKFASLAVGRNQSEELEVFGVKSDGSIWQTRQLLPNSGPWCGWTQFDPGMSKRLWKNVSLGRNQDGRLEIFGVAQNGWAWHARQGDNGWSDWANFHARGSWGRFLDQRQRFDYLVAAANMDTRLEVVGIGVDNSIWHTSQKEANGDWRKFRLLHKRWDRFVEIAVGANQNAGLEVFGLRQDFTPQHTWQR